MISKAEYETGDENCAENDASFCWENENDHGRNAHQLCYENNKFLHQPYITDLTNHESTSTNVFKDL